MAINYRLVFYRYKVGHVIGSLAIATCMFVMYYTPGLSVIKQVIWALVLTGVSLPTFFLSAYLLVPHYLYKRRIFAFIAGIVCLVLGFGISGWMVARFAVHIATGDPFIPSIATTLQLFNVIVWDNFIGVALGIALKIISDRFRMERRLNEVEKERVVTELNFLRSQINPHFLFNVMNTIYFQINKENIQARRSVETLSEMLRYQLYECTSDKIDIKKEVGYIQNYVAIQTLRMEKGSEITLSLDSNLSGFNIAPLMILPIIENAFKHVSHFKEAEKNKIHMTLSEDKGYFTVDVRNTYSHPPANNDVMNNSGLGIQNLKRRLELLYNDRYFLDITQDENVYKTLLKIKYND